MSSIKKVALAGATGNLGPHVLKALLDAGFEVTVLTRKDSSSKVPADVRVAKVDYESLDSITQALQGQDAVVSTLASVAIATQLRIVEAAAKANIKRFIPSEFGVDTLNEKVRQIPIFKDKLAVQDALAKEADSGGMSYTLIPTGAFLDWGMDMGFFINLKEKSIDLFDGGGRTFSATTLPTIGKAVAGVLSHPEETKNRAVYVQDVALSLKQLAAYGKKITGEDGWKENYVAVEDVYDQAWAELKKPEPNMMIVFVSFIKVTVWGEGYGGQFKHLDNELLGIKGMSENDVESLVRSYAK